MGPLFSFLSWREGSWVFFNRLSFVSCEEGGGKNSGRMFLQGRLLACALLAKHCIHFISIFSVKVDDAMETC